MGNDGNQLLLRKAVYASSDLTEYAGKMGRTQADYFIDMTVNESVMLKSGLSRTVRRDHRQGRINRIKFGEAVTYGAEEGVEVTRTVKPTSSYLDYTTRKLTSAIDMNTETLELNVEGEAHEQTIAQGLATRMAHDFENVAINGDTVAYAADGSANGLLLRTMDGWFKQSAAGLIVDAEGTNISKVLLGQMIRTMPTYYLQRLNELRFYVSPGIYQDYRDQLASRSTPVGDDALMGNGPMTYGGIPIVLVPLIPQNLDSYDGSSNWNNASFIWLTVPNNFVRVITRDIEVYYDFRPRFDQWQWTLYTYQGLYLENTEAMVTAVNVRLHGAI